MSKIVPSPHATAAVAALFTTLAVLGFVGQRHRSSAAVNTAGHVGTGSVSRRLSPETTTAGPDMSACVWVNTGSGIYHYAGSPWYGKTKQGVFLSEEEARQKGYRSARNEGPDGKPLWH